MTCRSSANFVSAGQKLRQSQKCGKPPKGRRPKKWKKKKVDQRIEDCSKVKTFTATAHMTFPLNYHSKNDLRPLIMFIVETGNRNPHVRKHDLRQSAKIKDDNSNAKTTNVKLCIMFKLDFSNTNKSKMSNLLYDLEC